MGYFSSEAARNLQRYLEDLLQRGFNDLNAVDSFLLYVLIKFPEVIDLFDDDNFIGKE